MENKKYNNKQELIAFYSRLLRYYDALASSPKNSIQHRRLLRATEEHMAEVYRKINQLTDNSLLSPGRTIIASLRRRYPVGCRVILDGMDDPQAPPVGTIGTVVGIDDIGSVLVNWDAGGSLSLAYGADKFHRLYTVERCDGEAVDLQTMYPSGSRIMLDHSISDAISAGTTGTVKMLYAPHMLHVKLDGGEQTEIILGKDKFHRIWDTGTTVSFLTEELLQFCEDNHYRQSPTIIGLWQPGALSEQTREALCSPTGIEKIIKGIYHFRHNANLPQPEQARADKLLHDLFMKYLQINKVAIMAKCIIDDFIRREYAEWNGADISDLCAIPVANTTTDGVEIQVCVDLIGHSVKTYANGSLKKTIQRQNLIELVVKDLNVLDFNELVDWQDGEEAT